MAFKIQDYISYAVIIFVVAVIVIGLIETLREYKKKYQEGKNGGNNKT